MKFIKDKKRMAVVLCLLYVIVLVWSYKTAIVIALLGVIFGAAVLIHRFMGVFRSWYQPTGKLGTDSEKRNKLIEFFERAEDVICISVGPVDFELVFNNDVVMRALQGAANRGTDIQIAISQVKNQYIPTGRLKDLVVRKKGFRLYTSQSALSFFIVVDRMVIFNEPHASNKTFVAWHYWENTVVLALDAITDFEKYKVKMQRVWEKEEAVYE